MATTVRKRDSKAPDADDARRDEHGQPSFTFTIDGQTVRATEGQTILSAAITHGILGYPQSL